MITLSKFEDDPIKTAGGVRQSTRPGNCKNCTKIIQEIQNNVLPVGFWILYQETFYQWVGRTVVAVLGKGFAVAAFCTIVLYSSELYPTILRQNGMGYNSFLGRLGVSVAPLVLLLDSFWGHFSQTILCSVALIASVVAWQLPETRDRCLPETIEDVEGTGKNLIKDHDKRENEEKMTTNELIEDH